MKLLNGAIPASGGSSILESAYEFSRMLHGSGANAGDAFYRAFVPELGSTLYPRQIELVKRCMRSERGDPDRVGATIFPGLVKVTRGPVLPSGQASENVQVRTLPSASDCSPADDCCQTVVRRAQVICECAMNGTAAQMAPVHNGLHSPASGA